MSECWAWQGAYNNKGYPTVWLGNRKYLAHRVAYERWRGPIPRGKQLDHLCRDPRCVNPEHLEAVTCRENLLRSEKTWARRNTEKTRCLRGHRFERRVTRQGWRWCRACKL